MLENIPLWLKIGAGVLAVGGVGYAALSRNQPQSEGQQASQSAPVTMGANTTPLLMPTMGGSSQAAPVGLPLGGEAWAPKTVPLSQDKDYAIAQINAGVQSEAIKASQALQTAALQYLFPVIPPTTGAVGKPEWRGNDIVQGTEFVKSQLASIGKTGEENFYRTIYNKAKGAGYSATETAQSISSALGKKITPDQVNSWIKERNLGAL